MQKYVKYSRLMLVWSCGEPSELLLWRTMVNDSRHKWKITEMSPQCEYAEAKELRRINKLKQIWKNLNKYSDQVLVNLIDGYQASEPMQHVWFGRIRDLSDARRNVSTLQQATLYFHSQPSGALLSPATKRRSAFPRKQATLFFHSQASETMYSLRRK